MISRTTTLITSTLLALLSGCAAAPERTARAADANEPVLELMTFNVNYGLAGDPDTLDAILAPAADIALLQETTPAWEAALTGVHDYPEARFVHRGGAGGMAVLSAFPIVEEEVIEPSGGGWFPAWRLVFDTPLGLVQVLNVHLRPPFSDGGSVAVGYFTTPEVRLREMEAFVARLRPDVATVVVGDFNEDESGPAITLLGERGMRSALPEFAPEAQTWRWNTSVGRVGSRLDHVVYDAALEPIEVRVLDRGRSDHLPVVAVLTKR